jgi:single-strand DNA-binding protein
VSSLNKIELIGNVGRDPESRTMQSGGKVVTFSVATSEKWKDRASGESRERTQWHRIVVFNEHLGDIAEKWVKKGSLVFVEGQMESRKFTDSAGQEREAFEVVLRPYHGTILMLGDGRGGDRESGGGRREAPQQRQGGGSGQTSWETPSGGQRQAGGGGGRSPKDLDDDIPFEAPWQ